MRFRMTRLRSLVVTGLVGALALAAYLLRPRPIYDYQVPGRESQKHRVVMQLTVSGSIASTQRTAD
jgi:hypothetical protein